MKFKNKLKITSANARCLKHKNGGQIQRLQLGKPIKWLAHQINSYGNSESKAPSIPGTSLAWAISDEMKRNPKLTRQQAIENIERRSEKVRRKVGIPKKKSTPSQAAAGLAVIGGAFSPWFAVPDIVFDTAAFIDEPSTSNTLHTVVDFPEAIAKVTPTKVDDYVARGVQMIGNVDDALSARGKNLFGVFDGNFNGNHGQVNNTIDKTSVRESTRVNSPKRVESIKRKKLGGIVKADDGIKFTLNDGLALGSQLIGNAVNSIQQNKFIDSQIKANKAQNKYLQSQIWNNSLSKARDHYTKQFEENQKKFNSGESLDNPSQIVAAHSAWDTASKEANNQISNLNNQLQLDNQQLQQQKKSILGSSLGIAGNFITNKFNNYDFG